MKKRRVINDFRDVLLTNKVERDSLQFQSILDGIQSDRNVPAILVVRVEEAFPGCYIVIDGNHRAVAHAFLKCPVRFFEIRSEKDIDKILKVETRGGFSNFPHRRFLTGDKSMETLVHEAIVSAARDMKGETAASTAASFRKTSASPNAPSRVVQRTVRKATPPPSRRTHPSETAGTQKTEGPLPKVSSPGVLPDVRPEDTAVFLTDGVLARWERCARSHFAERSIGQEFACPYAELARICGEVDKRGPEVAKHLVAAGVLRICREFNFRLGNRPGSQNRQVQYWVLLPRSNARNQGDTL